MLHPYLTPHTPLSCLSFVGAGLVAVDGARAVIKALGSRPHGSVSSIRLAHNALGDDGLEALLAFLSEAGPGAYPVETLDLDDTTVGNDGLRALAGYLRGNEHLHTLHLQNNLITGDDDDDASSIGVFADALNDSRLHTLTLSSNFLTDAFTIDFFPALTSPHLTTLALSSASLTPLSIPTLTTHLTSRASPQYTSLTLTDNALSHTGVKALIAAASTGQFRLQDLNLYANWDAPPEGDHEQWTALRPALNAMLNRNTSLRRQTRGEALRLLRCARPALLRPSRRLPAEIVLDVLAALAPSLSYAQRAHVLSYAADARTLPLLDSGVMASMPPPPLPPTASEKKLGWTSKRARTSSWGSRWTSATSTSPLGWRESPTPEVRTPEEVEREEWLTNGGCGVYDAIGVRD